MKAGTLLVIVAEVIAALEQQGYILPGGDFNTSKFDNAQADVELAAEVEKVLAKHGVAIPAKVDKIVQMIPLIYALLD